MDHKPQIQLFTCLDAADRNLYKPLHQAADKGNTAIIIALVEEGGATVNDPGGERGDTPLIMSARSGHSQAAKYLLSQGADVTAINEDGDTALSVAKTTSMVQILKEAWTEATDVKGNPPTPDLSAECRDILGSQDQSLSNLDITTEDDFDSESEFYTPTHMMDTPSDADDVFHDNPEEYRKKSVFITEVSKAPSVT